MRGPGWMDEDQHNQAQSSQISSESEGFDQCTFGQLLDVSAKLRYIPRRS